MALPMARPMQTLPCASLTVDCTASSRPLVLVHALHGMQPNALRCVSVPKLYLSELLRKSPSTGAMT
jgi:hypothetical protein